MNSKLLVDEWGGGSYRWSPTPLPHPPSTVPLWHRSNVNDNAYVGLPTKILLKIIGSIFLRRLIFLSARVLRHGTYLKCLFYDGEVATFPSIQNFSLSLLLFLSAEFDWPPGEPAVSSMWRTSGRFPLRGLHMRGMQVFLRQIMQQPDCYSGRESTNYSCKEHFYSSIDLLLF
jgi:hypothetical protein